MMQVRRALVVVVLCLFTVSGTAVLFSPMATTAQTTPSTASKIAQQYLDAVVTVIALDENQQPLALGTGFFIDQQGQVVTNAHVIEGASAVIVRSRAERRDAVRVTRFDRRYDAVILETGFQRSTPVSMGDSGNVAVGEDVVVLGNPRGLEGTVSTGIVSARREISGVQYLQITAPISPGSSGGPVFNASGRVIGIATATVSRGQNLNFALVASVLGALPPVDMKFKTVKTVPLETNDVSRWKDLVRPTNVIENIAPGDGWLRAVTFSIQNDTRLTIKDVTVLLVARSPTGQPLDFALQSFGDAIPPGLARQVTIGGSRNLNIKGYAQPSNAPGPIGKFTAVGKVELRILDFKTLTAETPVEQLLKPR